MEIKKTNKGWKYAGILFKDRHSAELSKQVDEEVGEQARLNLPKAEEFRIAYDGTQAKSFGIFVECLIKDRGMSIVSLASELGVSRPCLYSWMAGESLPTPANVTAIARFTKQDPQIIIFDALKDNFEYQPEKLLQAVLKKIAPVKKKLEQ